MSKLYFRYGAMNSGKTTSLIQVAFNYEERGMKVKILKPAVDSKGDEYIVSRIGVKRKVDKLIQKGENLFDLDYSNISCIIVDEAQFLEKKQVEDLFKIAVLKNIPVICYGLRTDFRAQGFEGSTRLLEIAHSIEELKTICRCGKKAVLNIRKVNGKITFEGTQVEIDDKESIEYEAVCGKCFYQLKNKED